MAEDHTVTTFYVDGEHGLDTNDGRSDVNEGGGHGPKKTIGSAVDEIASDYMGGYEIFVRGLKDNGDPITYSEEHNGSGAVICLPEVDTMMDGSPNRIIGYGRIFDDGIRPILDCRAVLNNAVVGWSGLSNAAILKNFSIWNSVSLGANLNYDVRFYNCEFNNCGDGAIYANWNCWVSRCRFRNCSGGMIVDMWGSTVTECTFEDCVAVYNVAGADFVLHCVLVGNTAGMNAINVGQCAVGNTLIAPTRQIGKTAIAAGRLAAQNVIVGYDVGCQAPIVTGNLLQDAASLYLNTPEFFERNVLGPASMRDVSKGDYRLVPGTPGTTTGAFGAPPGAAGVVDGGISSGLVYMGSNGRRR